MKARILKNINLVIDCSEEMPTRVSDFLAFLSFYSFYLQFGKTLNPLILINRSKVTNISIWGNSFNIPIIKKKIDFEKIIERPSFRIKNGIIILNQNFDNNFSFNAYDSFGLEFYSGEKIKFSNLGLFGNLDDNFSCSFVNLNQGNNLNIVNETLNNSMKIFSKSVKKINEVLFMKILNKAYKLYVNFPEVR